MCVGLELVGVLGGCFACLSFDVVICLFFVLLSCVVCLRCFLLFELGFARFAVVVFSCG